MHRTIQVYFLKCAIYFLLKHSIYSVEHFSVIKLNVSIKQNAYFKSALELYDALGAQEYVCFVTHPDQLKLS